MAPFNFESAQRFPNVANNVGYSPVAELLQLARNKVTTSGLMPIAADPMGMLQGIAGLQGQTVGAQNGRFDIVRNRMQEALAEAEQAALQARMDRQNRLLAEQNRIANTPSISSFGGYTPPVSNIGGSISTSSNPSLPFLPSGNSKVRAPVVAGDRSWDRELVFPPAKPPKKTKSQKIPSHILDKNSRY